ncbi:basic salivary proline-rich protein 1-like [Falco rusticolus]|uniref:basic salivary proline-rich protein 1-like n=1 Tax=Falco rusticolus TaxID=120794 RepID=UPI0018868BFA|nr:basic salivary proline-rich protein 1-like [Falco rusticolus]
MLGAPSGRHRPGCPPRRPSAAPGAGVSALRRAGSSAATAPSRPPPFRGPRGCAARAGAGKWQPPPAPRGSGSAPARHPPRGGPREHASHTGAAPGSGPPPGAAASAAQRHARWSLEPAVPVAAPRKQPDAPLPPRLGSPAPRGTRRQPQQMGAASGRPRHRRHRDGTDLAGQPAEHRPAPPPPGPPRAPIRVARAPPAGGRRLRPPERSRAAGGSVSVPFPRRRGRGPWGRPAQRRLLQVARERLPGAVPERRLSSSEAGGCTAPPAACACARARPPSRRERVP